MRRKNAIQAELSSMSCEFCWVALSCIDTVLLSVIQSDFCESIFPLSLKKLSSDRMDAMAKLEDNGAAVSKSGNQFFITAHYQLR